MTAIRIVLSRKFSIFMLLVIFSIFPGCSSITVYESQHIPSIDSGKIVFLGFKPSLDMDQKSGIFQNPISGKSMWAEPVNSTSADLLSGRLYNMLREFKNYKIIYPEAAKGLFDDLASNKTANNQIKVFKKIGKTFSADLVIAGYVYRWHEREGNEYTAEKPASVAFELYLISANSGAVLWSGDFDKTQIPLTENLLNIKMFFKYKGKWVKADKLAEIGLEELVDHIPLKK